MNKKIDASLSLFFSIIGLLLIFQFSISNAQQKLSNNRIQKLKSETIDLVQAKHKMTQIMIDKVFSFAELGHQEYETSKYLTGILNKAGFEIEYGISSTNRLLFCLEDPKRS